MKEQEKIVHVGTWEEFKRLAITLRPSFMAYSVQNAPLSRPRLGLRLVFSSESVQYVFLDFAHGRVFSRTKLPVYTNNTGNASFHEEDLKNFIQTELNRRDISILSFEVLGY